MKHIQKMYYVKKVGWINGIMLFWSIQEQCNINAVFLEILSIMLKKLYIFKTEYI